VFKKEFAKESNDRWNRKELERMEICEKLFKKIKIYLKKRVEKQEKSTFNPLYEVLKDDMQMRQAYFAIEPSAPSDNKSIEQGERTLENKAMDTETF
jgi:uncharacterized protein (UPF0262 family)